MIVQGGGVIGALIFALRVRNQSSSVTTGDSIGASRANGQEFVERAGIHHRARDAVMADLAALLDD